MECTAKATKGKTNWIPEEGRSMRKASGSRVEVAKGSNAPWHAIGFACSTGLLLVLFHAPLMTLLSLVFASGHDADQYSHVALIPIVSAYLILRQRKRIFFDNDFAIARGIGVLAGGVVILLVSEFAHEVLNEHDYLCGLMASLVVLEIGNFILFFGAWAFRVARFPLLILILMVPFPTWVLERLVRLLQEGSAVVTSFLLSLTGVPFVQEGLVFHLPHNLNILIAEDCSGIRSSIALLIASLLASDVFLHRGWTKLGLNVAVLPLSLFKNGLRIATLSLLSVYVDKRFISGDLHRDGGIVFYLIACAMLGLLLWRLRILEGATALVRQQRGKGHRPTPFEHAEAPFEKQAT
jgi:exosortase